MYLWWYCCTAQRDSQRASLYTEYLVILGKWRRSAAVASSQHSDVSTVPGCVSLYILRVEVSGCAAVLHSVLPKALLRVKRLYLLRVLFSNPKSRSAPSPDNHFSRGQIFVNRRKFLGQV